ncbi:hypothetical protein Tco_1253968 [Tanacetum coccineum]
MEILTLMLKRGVCEDGEFAYHKTCSKQKIINISFADDLILFAHGDVHSARVVREALNEFKDAPGLVPSIPKSAIFFCNVIKRGKAKVSWDDVCSPKFEGGLGIRRLEEFNIALMSTHIWKIVTDKSMWVKWIHAYKLKTRSFWDVCLVANVSWGSRKVLQIRDIIRTHVHYKLKLGNGNKASIFQLFRLYGKMFITGCFQCPSILKRSSIVGRLVVSATAYIVWQERNNPFHGKGERNPEQVTNIVADMLLLKLASIGFKNI